MALLDYTDLGNGMYKDQNNKYFKMVDGTYKNSAGQDVKGKVRSYVNPNQTLSQSSQIGNNLYETTTGRRYQIGKGTYTGADGKERYGDVRQYLQNPFEQRQGMVDDMFNKQKDARLNEFKQQRDKALGLIGQQKQETGQAYQGMRNQQDVVNQQGVQKLREIMASNGLSASGENVTANVNLNNQRQQSLNQLNLQEQQTMNDFERQITNLNDPANEQQIISQLEAERARMMYDAFNQGQQQAYQEKRDWIGDQRYDKEFDYRKQQDAAEKAWREHTFNNMSASEKATLEWAKTQYGEDAAWRMFELQYSGELQKSQSQAELDFYKNFSGTEKGGGYSNNYKTQQQSSKSGTFKTYQTHLNEAIKMGVPAEWAAGLTELVGRESSWNPSAKNPNSTAHGYGQFLNSTRSNYEKKTGLSYSNPVHQLVMMAQYVKDRYGTPEKALAFWDKNKWY